MSEFILPESAKIVDPISQSECDSLGNNTGLDIRDSETTCQALQTRLMPLLAQIMSDISSGTMTIYANDDSKCEDDDKSPTLASMLSRIYRVSQAFTCVLCQYDPTLSNMLQAGTYPQVLMGKSNAGAYPGWVTPDSEPTSNSKNLVTSDGIYKAIQNAITSVWHLWKEKGKGGTFKYFVEDSASKLPTSGNVNTDWAIVYNTSNHSNGLYQWSGTAWTLKETITAANMQNFSVIHIEKGDWEDKGLYWFETGWNLLDADLSEIEERIDTLEKNTTNIVKPIDNARKYKIGVAATYAAAEAVPAESGVTKIVFISGLD